MTGTAPRCCDEPMRLVGIENHDTGELRTYECDGCGKVDTREAETREAETREAEMPTTTPERSH